MRSNSTSHFTSSFQFYDGLTSRPRHVKSNTLRVCRFHGKPRPASPADLADYDVILTTYATLSAEYKNRKVLHRVDWYRIVLDEGKPTTPNRDGNLVHTILTPKQRIGFEIKPLPNSRPRLT